MFERLGSLTVSEVYKSAQDMMSGWYGFSREASATAVSSFDFDPKNFLYYRARAITADIPNDNGDYFPKSEVQAAYKTFIGKGVFYNHASEDPNNAFGLIL